MSSAANPTDLHQTLLQALLQARQAADKAAAFIQGHAGSVDGTHARNKGMHDLVSHVDEGAQDLIVDHLQSAFPEHTFFAEESYDPQSGASFSREGYVWIIDPLDGTTNFLHGVPHYGISIALMKDGELVLGLIQDVCRNETFYAIKGGGAFFQVGPLSDESACRVSETTELDESLLTTGFPYKEFSFVNGYSACLKRFMTDSRGIRRPGSASLDLAWVACGRFEGFFEQGLMPWDVAAGALIVREAGGVYSDFSGAQNAPLGMEIVASNGYIHQAMLDRLEPMRKPDA